MCDSWVLRRWQIGTTIAIIILSVAGTTLGLFVEGFYRDPDILLHQAYGQDTVTLIGVVPLLALGLWLARRGSLRGYLLWLGALGYVVYTYAVYAFITQFNPFFLGYVALFGLSAYTLGAGILQLDPAVVKARAEGTLPTRAVVWFFVGMALLVGLLWLSEVIPAMVANEPPASIADAGLPANVVHVLDLALLLPAMLLTSWWLHRGRPWGYVLPGVFFVKLTSIGVAILAMVIWMHMEGHHVRAEEIVVFVILTLVNGVFAIIYFRAIR